MPSLAEIQAQQASGNDKEPFPGSEVSALVVAAKEKRKQAEKKQRPEKSVRTSEFPRGCFWHLQGPLPRVRPSAMMSVGDLVYILKEFMRPLRADDPLRDDYYFVEAENKQLARKWLGLHPLPSVKTRV